MKILCVFSRYNYGQPQLGIGPEYAAFVSTLEGMGHEVLHFETWDRNGYQDFAELNVALLETVRRERPHVLLAVQTLYELWSETLQYIKALGTTATINWTTDDSWKYASFSRWIAHNYHAITTTYPDAAEKYRKQGIRDVVLTQWAATPGTMAQPKPAVECRYLITFVGSAHGNRRARVQALRDRGFDVRCFGRGWESGPISAEDIPVIMRDSVICLNFANSSRHNQIKARTFDVPGAGGFLLTENAPGLAEWYTPGQEIVTFGSQRELEHKLTYFLAHPDERDRIARAGHERTVREHTYVHRLSTVLSAALEAQRSSSAPDLREAHAAFHKALRDHHLTLGTRVLRQATLATCRVLFGKHRAAKAARRITFEVCWRLNARKTYSGTGLPGRMYYRET